MSRSPNVLNKPTTVGIALVAISVGLALLTLEIAVRVHRGRLLQVQSTTAEPAIRVRRVAYDPRLGWSPTPGRLSTGWTSNADDSGIRSNGRPISTAGRPILAVGDSFTFGDEVEDGETWAAQLEGMLGKRVLNAGVGAYGIDQAFLRAELLLAQHDPDVVLLAFISDDITRTEYSYYPYGRGWKPYFTYENESLVLKNVPVPQEPAPSGSGRWQVLRHVLGYSFLADTVLDRLARRWWRDLPTLERIHHDGEKVSVDLFVRLDGLTRARGARFVAIALATNGRIGDNARVPNLVGLAREKGITVLDLSSETLKLPASQLKALFRPGGHYSPTMNRTVAEQVAALLRDKGIRDRPQRSQSPGFKASHGS